MPALSPDAEPLAPNSAVGEGQTRDRDARSLHKYKLDAKYHYGGTKDGVHIQSFVYRVSALLREIPFHLSPVKRVQFVAKCLDGRALEWFLQQTKKGTDYSCFGDPPLVSKLYEMLEQEFKPRSTASAELALRVVTQGKKSLADSIAAFRLAAARAPHVAVDTLVLNLISGPSRPLIKWNC